MITISGSGGRALKKILIISAFMLVTILLSSCNSIPGETAPMNSSVTSSTEQATASFDASQPAFTPVSSVSPVAGSHTPQPSAANVENVVLNKEQNKKINALLTGALNISGESKATFFQDTSALTVDDLLGFVDVIINDEYSSVGMKSMNTGTVSCKVVENIIHSAFNIDYIPQEGDSFGDVLQYDGDSFMFGASDDILVSAYPYSIRRQPLGNILIKFNIETYGPPELYYLCKGEAVLQEDADSLFGYRLVSLMKADDSDLTFTLAQASSCLSADGSKTYGAQNVIDGDDSTVWAGKNGKGEWIKLYLNKPQYITGLILHFGDWSSDNAFDEHALPATCRLDFSDGTSIVDEHCQSCRIGDDTCFDFNKMINTSYIKITITDIVEGSEGTGGGVYISEIKPF